MEPSSGLEKKPASDPVSGSTINDAEVGASSAAAVGEGAAAVTKAEDVAQVKSEGVDGLVIVAAAAAAVEDGKDVSARG